MACTAPDATKTTILFTANGPNNIQKKLHKAKYGKIIIPIKNEDCYNHKSWKKQVSKIISKK
jgi:hypothetical protein